MRLVIAIVIKDGKVLSYATNEHENCKREGYPTGVGYELCDGCNYPNHAEYKALEGREFKGATLFLLGHTYACKPCTDEMERAGVRLVILQEEVRDDL